MQSRAQKRFVFKCPFLANIFSYPLSTCNIGNVIICHYTMKKKIKAFKLFFLNIFRYQLRFAGIQIILLIDNDSLWYTCI